MQLAEEPDWLKRTLDDVWQCDVSVPAAVNGAILLENNWLEEFVK